MIEDSLKNEIIEKIKEISIDQKPQFAALYHQLMELYKGEEALAVGNRHINKSREPIINTYSESASKLASGIVSVEHLGELKAEDGFFTAEEIAQIPSTQPAKIEKYWLTVLQKIEPVQSFIVPEDEPALASLTQVKLDLNAENEQ